VSCVCDLLVCVSSVVVEGTRLIRGDTAVDAGVSCLCALCEYTYGASCMCDL